MADALTADGGKLSARDKGGLGYTGEKVERNPYKRAATSDPPHSSRITTAYDDPEETDPAAAPNRRWDPTRNKNRPPRVKNVFTKP